MYEVYTSSYNQTVCEDNTLNSATDWITVSEYHKQTRTQMNMKQFIQVKHNINWFLNTQNSICAIFKQVMFTVL